MLEKDIPPAWFHRPDGKSGAEGIHGTGHTHRVWTHAMELGEAIGLQDRQMEVLHYAALWHDIGRTDDSADYYHGGKSAGKVVGLGLHAGLDPALAESVLFCVTHHCGSEEYARRASRWVSDPARTWAAFEVLKDADALDRVRIGDLDVSMLRHAESRGRVRRAWALLHERHG